MVGEDAERSEAVSIKKKSVTVWMLADGNGSLLAHGNPNSIVGGLAVPPYHAVSMAEPNQFFGERLVWGRTKWELKETGAGQEWNHWNRKYPHLKVHPVKIRAELEEERKEKNP